MGSFVKIYGSILDSSIWDEPMATRLVWITMLAMADENGIVEASVGGLARRAVVPRDACEAALEALSGPDPDSRDGTTGERIEKVPGGWLILNHGEYRDRQTRTQRLTAERVRRHRERRKHGVTGNGVTPGNETSPPEAEAEAEADPEREKKRGSLGNAFAHEANMMRPNGARTWGGRREIGIINDMIDAYGLEKVRAVVASVTDRELWNKLWGKEGTIFQIVLSDYEAQHTKKAPAMTRAERQALINAALNS